MDLHTQAMVHTAQMWLQSSWNVQVPFTWLEACVEWLMEEGHAQPKQDINQQVLDQWLLTDLRDLAYPVLPEGLQGVQKVKLSGSFCVQVDSVLDISQGAYGQLQHFRGTDSTNEEVSAVTQNTSRPRDSKTSRMLLLQITDGAQNLEAMEYRSISALSTSMRPGVKLQLKGQIICRLGVLLLGPENVLVLGGEVEDLKERHNQGRVLSRALGLPEPSAADADQHDGLPPRPENQEADDFNLDDQELLSSLEAHEERMPLGSSMDPGYGTQSEDAFRSDNYMPLSRGFSGRSKSTKVLNRSGYTENFVQKQHGDNYAEDLNNITTSWNSEQETPETHRVEEHFPCENPQQTGVFQNVPVVVPKSSSSHRETSRNVVVAGAHTSSNRWTSPPKQLALKGSGSSPVCGEDKRTESGKETNSHNREAQTLNPYSGSLKFSDMQAKTQHSSFVKKCKIVDKNVDNIFLTVPQTFSDELFFENTRDVSQQSGQESSTRDLMGGVLMKRQPTNTITCNTSHGIGYPLRSEDKERLPAGNKLENDSKVHAESLNSLPFTYLCLVQDWFSEHVKEIRVKAFIVTLLGKMTSSTGMWHIDATISDGTAYLDVEVSHVVLAGLLGFSVEDKIALKNDPSRRGELSAGIKRCQEGLVDMCCVMTIVLEDRGRKAVVTNAKLLSEEDCEVLQERVRQGKKS